MDYSHFETKGCQFIFGTRNGVGEDWISVTDLRLKIRGIGGCQGFCVSIFCFNSVAFGSLIVVYLFFHYIQKIGFSEIFTKYKN